MPQPVKSQVHVDKPLTNISHAYMQNTAEFISDRVFPIVPVAKQSDKYFTYTRSFWNRVEAQYRAPGTESAGGGYELSTATYSCDVYAFHKDVDDQTRANTDAPLNADVDATEFVTRQLLLKREVDWASKYFSTSIWANTDQTGVASGPTTNQFLQWGDEDSVPIQDITGQRTTILQSTGYEPNTLVLGAKTYEALTVHPDIVDRIKYTQGGGAIVTTQLLAALFGVDNVFVTKAIKNTAKEGQTESSSFVMSSTGALLVYAARSPGLRQPSGGYTFGWQIPGGSGGGTPAIYSFRMEHLKSTRVEGEMAYDQKLVASDLGVYFTSCWTVYTE